MSNSTEIRWLPSADARFECCNVEFDGRRYLLHRDASGAIVKVAKYERTNSYGARYWPLNVKGAAARAVIRAVRECRA